MSCYTDRGAHVTSCSYALKVESLEKIFLDVAKLKKKICTSEHILIAFQPFLVNYDGCKNWA